jgi:outer membrane lipoprotein SlyB
MRTKPFLEAVMIPRLFFALILSSTLAACANTGSSGGLFDTGAPRVDNGAVHSGYGTVESVQTVDKNNPGLLGTIGGAVVGGLLGNQIGSGSGRTAATIAGAAGGALAGREIERRARSDDEVYKIFVRRDDGTYQAVAQESAPVVRPGDRVRVYNGIVTPI